MGVNIKLDNWLVSNRYVYDNIKKFGALKRMSTDYDIYLKCVATMKIAGIQIDKKSKTFYIGRTKSFMTKQTKENLITKTVLAYSRGSSGYYDDSLEESLGGNRMTLGE